MELQALLNIPQLRYLAQDESRIGRKTEPKRVITAKGVKPKVSVNGHGKRSGSMGWWNR